MDPRVKIVQRNPSSLIPNCRDEVNKEVDHIFLVGLIKQVEFIRWVSNNVVETKKSCKFGVFIDFTNFNNSCQIHPIPNLAPATISILQPNLIGYLSSVPSLFTNGFSFTSQIRYTHHLSPTNGSIATELCSLYQIIQEQHTRNL